MKLKVCGLQHIDNLRQVLECKPDFIGIICYEKSQRYAGRMNAAELCADFPSGTNKVGVFVNASLEYIKRRIQEFELNVVQLHGNEDHGFCHSIKELNVEIIKVFHVDNQFDFSIVNSYSGCSDYFLFDTKTEAYGGSGKQFDWRLLHQLKFDRPVFLSGGISLADIGQIMRELPGISGIDINSRFETSPGIKDIQQIRKAKQLIEQYNETVYSR
ncbi:MAG TPA: phosphoribosylanthranilate isomerase [Bacteroidia bacterium]